MTDIPLKKVKFPLPSRYVMAVSGGVDSVSLLNLMAEKGGYDLVVAHFSHGIRPDSVQDLELVHNIANAYGLEFIGESQQLGAAASEAEARAARYRFLEEVRTSYRASAIITAHHLDDRIETMLLNRQRGAGWRGLAPLRETDTLKRPLLGVWKEELRGYANSRNLKWREDSTNLLLDTPRNHIRDQLLSDPQRKLKYAEELKRNDEFRRKREETLIPLVEMVAVREGGDVHISRSKLLQLNTDDARDVLFSLLQAYPDLEVSRRQVIRLEHFIKTAKVSKRLPLGSTVYASAERNGVRVARLYSEG